MKRDDIIRILEVCVCLANVCFFSAGMEGGIVVAKCENKDWGYGYDAAIGEYNDLLESGVLDPAKVK